MESKNFKTFSILKPVIDGIFNTFVKTKKYSKRLEKIKKRSVEVLSIPAILIAGFLVKVMLSFTGWIRALLMTWGVMDGFASNYIYREESFFPYQFLRYARIIANFSGIINPFIPVFWNIGDGIYSMLIYKDKASSVETLPRLGRILNGTLQAVF